MTTWREMVDTSDEWIVQRTGIRERHIAAEGELTSDLGVKAARAALDDAGLDAQSIDLIIVGTSTPDNTFPATAVASRPGSASRTARRSTSRRCARASSTRWRPPTAVAHRRAQARAGDRRGDLLAHPRLDRPRHLRAVRRRRRRGGARGAAAAGHARGPRRAHGASALRRPLQGRSSMSTAARPRPARSAICAWRAARSSSTRSA